MLSIQHNNRLKLIFLEKVRGGREERHMNNRWARLIGLLAFILLTLVSCGQKGDLYLPDEKRAFLEIPRMS
jgi:hypothetical protein